jgi:cardiolipin synthase
VETAGASAAPPEPEWTPPAPISWIPNILTGVRLALVPTFVIVSRQGDALGTQAGWLSPAFWMVAGAGISDVLDGFLARRWHLTSRIGALMDAVADKSFQFTALVTITFLGRPVFSQLPFWLLGAVFLRDFILLVGWALLKILRRPVNFEHEGHGRIATIIVFVLIVSATLGIEDSWLLPAAAVAAITAVTSAIAYFTRGLRLALAAGPQPR